MRLVNSVNDRDFSLTKSVKCYSSFITSQRDFVCITQPTKFEAEPHMTHT